jgi:23S rRNA (pseudouridine1915-N3)-methyltransferase
LKITLLWVGKTKSQSLFSLLEDYKRRVRHFCDLSVVEIKPSEDIDSLQIVVKESERLLGKVQPADYVIILDAKGKSLTTEKFTNLILERREHSLKNLVFVIGGHCGLSVEMRSRANLLLSLSKMTLNHELTRVILMEQIYRAFCLIHHIPYHK